MWATPVIVTVLLTAGCFFKPDRPGATSGDGGSTMFGPFQQKLPVPISAGPGSETGPELSPNQLELYFMSERAVIGVPARRLWVAQRGDVAQPFGNVTQIGGIDQADPAIMPESLTLYFFDCSYLIHRLDRAAIGSPWGDFQLPISVPGTGPFDIGGNGLTMIAGTSRVTDPGSCLLEYTRISTTDSWLTAASRPAVANTEAGDVSPTLSSDGLELWWEHRSSVSTSSVYYTHRNTVAEPFPAGEKLMIPGVTFAYGSPEISADGTELYFTELQGGDFKIFVTRRARM